MISKGNTHADGAKLADYMTTGKVNERAELWELRGFGLGNIGEAFRTVHVMAEATHCKQPFFHAQVRNRDGETLTRTQWSHTADRIEAMLGLKDQPRAIAFHIDDETTFEHMHIAWSRIDEDTLTARPLPFFKDRLKRISRKLEAEFGLEPVTNKREGNIKFAPTRAEHEQARRLGQDIHEQRDTIRECWDRSDCGRSFQSALEHEGFTLAKGDRRSYVVIDGAGGLHALGKRILDMSAAKIRARLSDLSEDHLPTVEAARAVVQDIAKKTAAPQDVKPEERRARDKTRRVRAGNRKKEGLIHPSLKEISAPPTPDSGHDANAIELCAEPISKRPDSAGASGAVPECQSEINIDAYRGAREARGKSRSPGLYRKALNLTGILRQQFRQLASLLTGHASDPERARRQGTWTDGNAEARPHHKKPLPIETHAVVDFIADTLDWLNLWHNDTESFYDSDDDFQQTGHDHLYPHL